MLKNIDPVLAPELLKILAEMGHDDALVLADANFTAVRLAQGKPLIRLPGIGLARAAEAIASVLPLASDVPHPIAYMQVGGTEAPYQSAAQRAALAAFATDFSQGQSAESLDRFDFYDRAERAFAIVLTGEMQPFANLIVRKGVIADALVP